MTNLERLKEILDITHNRNTGISKYVGHQRLGNLVVYKPEDINRIGHLCREAIAEKEL